MSLSIPTAHVQAFKGVVTHLSQQMGSRIRQAVTVETGLPGTRYNFDQLGKVTATRRTSRHGDSPLISTPHSRRIIDLVDFEWGDLVDNEDKVRTIYDPVNPYTEAGIFAHGRAMDSEIVTAFDATATIGGTDGLTTTTEAWGGTAIDATDNAASLANLITARGLLRKAEHIKNNERLFCVCSSDFIDDVLTMSEVQSIDQNTYRALVGGEVTTFMGMTFIQTELVGNIGADNEKTYIFPQSAIKLGIGADITAMVERRADKSYAWYPYVRMSIGATRTQSDNVVVIETLRS